MLVRSDSLFVRVLTLLSKAGIRPFWIMNARVGSDCTTYVQVTVGQ